jgi:hypothetical protein
VRCAARGKDQRGPWRGVRAPDAATQCDVPAGRCPAPRTAHRHEQCTCAAAECASTRTRACTEPCAHGRCSAACAEQLCQCAWGAWAGVWGTHTRGGWYCGGIPRLHPRRLQITVHFSGLGHQPERHLSAALQPRPRPGAPTQHPNVSAATPGPMTLSCRARRTAPRPRPTQRALCHAPGAHLGRHTTVCPKLKVWDQTMKNTGASPARVPFGQPKKRGKSMPGGGAPHRTGRPSSGLLLQTLPFGRAIEHTSADPTTPCATRETDQSRC